MSTEENQPKIVARQSVSLNLHPGTYWYCCCGKSSDQPFCDGSHEGSSFRPKRFSIDTPKRVSLCLCKHSKNNPYCDGTHRHLKPESTS